MASARFAQIIMGPAGSGKSTFISRLLEHFETTKRVVNAINLDPAADNMVYTPIIDIREATNVKEYMEKYGDGPNGALIHCMDDIVNDYEWFDNSIGEHDNDYLLVDLPGQIELFSHLNILPRLFQNLQRKGYHLCSVFLLDSQFMCDPAKFLSGCLVAITATTMMEIPHVNLLSKCDLLSEEDRTTIDEFCEMDITQLGGAVREEENRSIGLLTQKICELISNFNMIQFTPFDPTDNESVAQTVGQIDMLLNYYEDAEFNEENEARYNQENENNDDNDDNEGF